MELRSVPKLQSKKRGIWISKSVMESAIGSKKIFLLGYLFLNHKTKTKGENKRGKNVEDKKQIKRKRRIAKKGGTKPK